MADWRQIQARIRKAKASADPVPALTRIYDRTRDGMAAFELGGILENASRVDEALAWYAKAWQRFRRPDWKRKAAEAMERLGGVAPQEGTPAGAVPAETEARELTEARASEPVFSGEAEVSAREPARERADTKGMMAAAVPGPELPGEQPRKKRSRRGRRGGRRHRRGRERQQQAPVQPESVAPAEPAAVAPPPAPQREPERGRVHREPKPQEPLPVERPRVGSEWAAQVRSGDPGLASRTAQLESKLRRLVASPLYRMSDVEQAPAGPGVFVLSDSDHTTYYYVEACRTLRIALGNIARGRTNEGSLKRGLAEHLGISESQVGKYIKEHCVVRWLQMDEDAARLAHFAIAVLGPVLNE